MVNAIVVDEPPCEVESGLLLEELFVATARFGLAVNEWSLAIKLLLVCPVHLPL